MVMIIIVTQDMKLECKHLSSHEFPDLSIKNMSNHKFCEYW